MKTLKPVHIPSPKMREFRALVKHRKSLDQRINRLKNSIRSVFVNHGIQIDHGKRAWCSGRQHLNSFRKPIGQCAADEFWKAQLDQDLAQLDFIAEQLETAETKLDELAKDNPHVQRLMTIPGVGRKTAEVLVAAIDDPHRFRNAREVSSYIGLVPKQYQSGQTDRHGRITKRGSRLLRTMLVECAWAALRYNAWAQAVYERIHGGQKTRRKKAGIALARKLAVVAWAMMRDETDWDIARVMPECELEQGAIAVKQEPNLPAGPVHHLPKPLREPPAAGLPGRSFQRTDGGSGRGPLRRLASAPSRTATSGRAGRHERSAASTNHTSPELRIRVGGCAPPWRATPRRNEWSPGTTHTRSPFGPTGRTGSAETRPGELGTRVERLASVPSRTATSGGVGRHERSAASTNHTSPELRIAVGGGSPPRRATPRRNEWSTGTPHPRSPCGQTGRTGSAETRPRELWTPVEGLASARHLDVTNRAPRPETTQSLSR